jgi:hypothetical protein
MSSDSDPFGSRVFPEEMLQQYRRSRPGTPGSASGASPAAEIAEGKRRSGPAAVEPSRFTSGKAADICQRFPLSEPAAALMTGDLTPKRYLDLLTENNLYGDATRVLAHGLPKRDAIRWACLCLREVLGTNASPKTSSALETAEKWVKNPSEENRRAGLPAAEVAGFSTPAGLIALAAFWSGGSLTPPDAPVVPPADHMTGEGVAGAVLLAGNGAPPDDVPKRQRRFLGLGLGVINGK